MNKVLLIITACLLLLGCSGIAGKDEQPAAPKDSASVGNGEEFTIGRFIIIPFEQMDKKTGL